MLAVGCGSLFAMCCLVLDARALRLDVVCCFLFGERCLRVVGYCLLNVVCCALCGALGLLFVFVLG